MYRMKEERQLTAEGIVQYLLYLAKKMVLMISQT